jgi:hypothetical protein
MIDLGDLLDPIPPPPPPTPPPNFPLIFPLVWDSPSPNIAPTLIIRRLFDSGPSGNIFWIYDFSLF